MYFRKEIGKWGENIACKYLEGNKYQIIERNFSCKQGEIDIIAKDTKQSDIVFIQVKTRSNLKYGNPAESVNYRKRRHLKQTIQYYMYKNHMKYVPIRVDVIEIYMQEKGAKINHIEQAL